MNWDFTGSGAYSCADLTVEYSADADEYLTLSINIISELTVTSPAGTSVAIVSNSSPGTIVDYSGEIVINDEQPFVFNFSIDHSGSGGGD